MRLPVSLFGQRRSGSPLAWPGWGDDQAIATWSGSGPLEIRPVHGLRDPALLGAEARGGHGWTPTARRRLTALLLHMACDEALLWRDLPGASPLTVSARLPASGCDAGLVEQVAGALARTGLDAGLLELGFCLLAGAPAGPGELLAWSALRDMGLGLSIEVAPDAAAPGLPSHAGRLPFTALRLPAWVAERVEDEAPVRQLVREAVRAAAPHAACVIATGVRRAAQRDILADLGCDAAQGPLFGLPTHPAAFQAALTNDAFI